MHSLFIITVFLSFIGPSSAGKLRIDAHVSHGINTYNNKPIVDLTSSSNIFGPLGRIQEIGIINSNGKNATIITEDAPGKSIMATIDAYDYQKAFGFPPGVGPFNHPIANAPTLTILSQNLNDRVEPKSFAASSDPSVLGLPYRSRESDSKITLRDWNRVAGRISGRCKRGMAVVKVELKNGLPNGLYTMWDVGVLDPLTKKESLSAGPFGGLPNVLVTGSDGSGVLTRHLNYCPFDSCAGSKRCTLYVSLFYHFDHMVYAGSPVLDFAGQAVGHAAANQVQFFFNGKNLVPPQNKF